MPVHTCGHVECAWEDKNLCSHLTVCHGQLWETEIVADAHTNFAIPCGQACEFRARCECVRFFECDLSRDIDIKEMRLPARREGLHRRGFIRAAVVSMGNTCKGWTVWWTSCIRAKATPPVFIVYGMIYQWLYDRWKWRPSISACACLPEEHSY